VSAIARHVDIVPVVGVAVIMQVTVDMAMAMTTAVASMCATIMGTDTRR